MRPPLSSMLETVPVSGIRRFTALAAQTKGCVSLTIGEPDFDTPEPVREQAKAALDRGDTHYPPNVGTPRLLRAISDFEAGKGLKYDADEIVFTIGATEALLTALCGILDPGDEVVIPVPAFGLYEQIVKFCRAKCIFYDTREDGFQIKRDKLERLITTRTKAVILNSPNNPTGVVYNKRSLESVRDVLVDKPVFIISDEVYRDLCFDGAAPSVACFPELREQTLVVQSFSKPYAMTGWRAGYLMGDREVIASVKKIHQLAVVSGVSFVMDACVKALETDPSAMRETYKKRCDYVCDRLEKMGLSFVRPGGAFYVFPSVERFGMPSEDFVIKMINEAGLCLVPGSCFGAEGFVRISFCYNEKALQTGLDRLEGFINSL